MTQVIHQANDKLYKVAMSEPRVAKEFMQKHLPKAILAHMQLDSLKLENHSFIDEAFKASEADVIYSVQMQNSAAYIYTLCEHQSKPDKQIAFRLLGYMVRLMEHHLRQHPKGPLPLIYPLGVYSGQARWSAPPDIFSLFAGQAELARDWLFKPYQLVDIQRMSDEELKRHDWCGLMEFALKYQKIRNLAVFLDEFLPRLGHIETQGDAGVFLGKAVLHYLVDGVQAEDIDVFKQKANNYLHAELRGEAMTLAQAFERRGIEIGQKQGWEKGMQHGEATMITRQLQRRFGKIPPHYLEKIKQANAEILLVWGEKILDAEDIEEVFHQDKKTSNN